MPEKKKLEEILRDEIISLLVARYGEKQGQTATLSHIMNKMQDDFEILEDYREGNI